MAGGHHSIRCSLVTLPLLFANSCNFAEMDLQPQQEVGWWRVCSSLLVLCVWWWWFLVSLRILVSVIFSPISMAGISVVCGLSAWGCVYRSDPFSPHCLVCYVLCVDFSCCQSVCFLLLLVWGIVFSSNVCFCSLPDCLQVGFPCTSDGFSCLIFHCGQLFGGACASSWILLCVSQSLWWLEWWSVWGF